MDPASLALPAAINGVRLIVSTYEGYERGRFMETDLAVREEIRRRTVMLGDHVNKVHTRAHREEMRKLRGAADQVMSTIQSLGDDSQYSITGTPKSKHEGTGRLSKKARKKLVDHDLRTLEMLVNSTRQANVLLESFGRDAEETDLIDLTDVLDASVGRARNHFRERNMFIDGLVKR